MKEKLQKLEPNLAAAGDDDDDDDAEMVCKLTVFNLSVITLLLALQSFEFSDSIHQTVYLMRTIVSAARYC